MPSVLPTLSSSSSSISSSSSVEDFNIMSQTPTPSSPFPSMNGRESVSVVSDRSSPLPLAAAVSALPSHHLLGGAPLSSLRSVAADACADNESEISLSLNTGSAGLDGGDSDIESINSLRISLCGSPIPGEERDRKYSLAAADAEESMEKKEQNDQIFVGLRTLQPLSNISVDEWKQALSSILLRYYSMPVIERHMTNINGQIVMDECCSSACATIEAGVLAAERVHGVAGVLNYLFYNFGWGPFHLSHVCQALTTAAGKLDCGSSAVTAVQALRMSSAVRSGSLIACGVQLVMQGSSEETERHSKYFGRKGADVQWISSRAGLQYHQVVGVIQTKTKQLFVWDWGKWRIYPSKCIDQPHAILAMRIDALPQARLPARLALPSSSSAAAFPSFVRFGSTVTLPVNVWCTLLPPQLALASAPNFPHALRPESGKQWLTGDFLSHAKSAGSGNFWNQMRSMQVQALVEEQSVSSPLEISIFVSGIMMNDDNVAPGIGIARSIRHRFASPLNNEHSLPFTFEDSAVSNSSLAYSTDSSEATAAIRKLINCRVIGVDYGIESAGLNDSVFDASLCIQALVSTRAHQHFQQVRRRCGYLSDDPLSSLASEPQGLSFWIPSSDVETHMLAQSIADCGFTSGQTDRILVPPLRALETILKPCVPAGRILGMEIPPFALLTSAYSEHNCLIDRAINAKRSAMGEEVLCTSLVEVHRFCLLHGYPVYVKGLNFGAALCVNWQQVEKTMKSFRSGLGQPVYVQAAVTGFGKGIAFAAYKGKLTGALTLTKTGVTGLKKGWSGHLGAVSEDLLLKLEEFVRVTEWTGGGEVEYIEELDGRRHLIDFNPRFPAYIFASVHTKANLPAALLQHALHYHLPQRIPFPTVDQQNAQHADCQYTRTIIEVPANRMTAVLTGGPEVLPGHEERIRFSRVVEMSKALHRTQDNDSSSGQVASQASAAANGTTNTKKKDEEDEEEEEDKADEEQNLSNSSSSSVSASVAAMIYREERQLDKQQRHAAKHREAAKKQQAKQKMRKLRAAIQLEKGRAAALTTPTVDFAEMKSVADGVDAEYDASKSSSLVVKQHCKSSIVKKPSSAPCILPEALSVIPLRADGEFATSDLAKLSKLRLAQSAFTLSLPLPLPWSSLTSKLSNETDYLISSDSIISELSLICPSRAQLSNFGTPCFLLSKAAIAHYMTSICQTLSASVSAVSAPFRAQVCVSVKTQPAKQVLYLAKECGLLAEVISLAELRAALSVGYSMSQIVVNGPGKFVDHHPLDNSEPMLPPPQEPLNAVFADSLTDLDIILECINDPNHWMKSSVVGVRVSSAPLGSRFGVRMETGAMRRIVQRLRQLPVDVSIGFHFHYAAAFLGVDPWLGHAMSFVRVCAEIAEWSGRTVKILDFGGGTAPNLFLEPKMQLGLRFLFHTIVSSGRFPSLQFVYFEPGKALTERAGSLLMTVQHVREMRTALNAPSARGRLDDSTADGMSWPSNRDPISADEKNLKTSGGKGAVVDACICDVGSFVTHPHPLLFFNEKPKSRHDKEQEQEEDTESDNENENGSEPGDNSGTDSVSLNGSGQWEVLPGGKDVILGRICMEFDLLGASIQLPAQLKNGDKLLLAYTGAYDMSMSYDFGRGAGEGNPQSAMQQIKQEGKQKQNQQSDALPGAIPYYFI